MGICPTEKNMIIFRAINTNSLIYNLLLGIKNNELETIVNALINVNSFLEYSNALNNFKQNDI